MKKYSTLEETLAAITPLDEEGRWRLPRSAGTVLQNPSILWESWETLLIQIAGITGEVRRLTLPEGHWLPCARTTELWKRE